MIYFKTPRQKRAQHTHPHTLVLMFEDHHMLVPLIKAATLTPKVVEWLDETFEEGAWDWDYGMICFRTKEDAMGFKLRWS